MTEDVSKTCTLRAEISHISLKNETKETPVRTAARSFEAAAFQKPGRTNLIWNWFDGFVGTQLQQPLHSGFFLWDCKLDALISRVVIIRWLNAAPTILPGCSWKIVASSVQICDKSFDHSVKSSWQHVRPLLAGYTTRSYLQMLPFLTLPKARVKQLQLQCSLSSLYRDITAFYMN